MMEQNFDNFLFGQHHYSSSNDEIKFWAAARASSSSSQSYPEFYGQNSPKDSSSKNRTKKCLRLRGRNWTKKLATNALATTIEQQQNQRPKRKKSSEKERQRNFEIKKCIRTLTTLLPGVKTEIPRIRTLRLANRYIDHLGRILRGDHIFCEQSQDWRRLTIEDFERTVSEEMQTSNSYKERAEFELLMGSGSSGAETMEMPTIDF